MIRADGLALFLSSNCKCFSLRDVSLQKLVHTPSTSPPPVSGLKQPLFLGGKEWEYTGPVATCSAYLAEGFGCDLESYLTFKYIP